MKLYYHETDGGAKYLTDKFIICSDGSKEGVFEGAKYIVRIDGDITKDAELNTNEKTIDEKTYKALKRLIASNMDIIIIKNWIDKIEHN